jgi:hypothetical protein
MGQAKKMDCSASGEVILGARDRLQAKEGTLSDRSPMERIPIRPSLNLEQGARPLLTKNPRKEKAYAQ